MTHSTKFISVLIVVLAAGCELTAVDEDELDLEMLEDETLADEMFEEELGGDEMLEDDVLADAVVEGDLIEGKLSEQEVLEAVALATMPRYQLPFRCGQVWRGNTYLSHNPRPSVDFNRTNDFGDAVVAAARGTVTVVGDTGSDSYGKWIEIGHGGGHRTRYAHLSRRSVSVGQKVSRGQKIGEVGQSGGASGPHLHYEQRVDGVPVRARFNGKVAYYFGERRYTSHNCN